MARLVGRPPHRPELEGDAARLETRDLLGDESLRKTRPALQDDRDICPARLRHRWPKIRSARVPATAPGPRRRVRRPGARFRARLGPDADGKAAWTRGARRCAARRATRDNDVARQPLLRQVTQGGRHRLGRAPRPASSISTRPMVRAARARMNCFEARPGARHDDRAFVERQDFAEGVVTAHGNDTGRLLHQAPRLLVKVSVRMFGNFAARSLKASRAVADMNGPNTMTAP